MTGARRKPARAYDAVIVGSGPNGLAAAIALAQAGKSVAVFLKPAELPAAASIGRAEFARVPSSVYPLAIGSPFFASLPLAQHGLEWIEPAIGALQLELHWR